MAVGLVDLLSTAILYSLGLIVELNPLMRPLLEDSILLFAATKMATMAAAYVALVWYRNYDPEFTRKAAMWGTVIYVTIWTVGVLIGFA